MHTFVLGFISGEGDDSFSVSQEKIEDRPSTDMVAQWLEQLARAWGVNLTVPINAENRRSKQNQCKPNWFKWVHKRFVLLGIALSLSRSDVKHI